MPITEPKLCLAGRQNKARGKEEGAERSPDGATGRAAGAEERAATRRYQTQCGERKSRNPPMAVALAAAEAAEGGGTEKKKNFPPFENKCVKRCNLG